MRRLLTILLCLGAHQACAQTMEQMRSWCGFIDNVRVESDNRVLGVPKTADAMRCWEAFATIQQMSTFTYAGRTPLLPFCPAKTSSTVEFIKIFVR